MRRRPNDDRQEQMRRPALIKKDPVGRHHWRTVGAGRRAGIGIDVEMGEITARDVDTNPVSCGEQITGRESLDLDRVDGICFHEF